MSLITRCPACGTMFKVVPDQLRISEGWVRCGHCAEVFDARANFFDPEAQPAAQPLDVIPDPQPQPFESAPQQFHEEPLPEPLPESTYFEEPAYVQQPEVPAMDAPYNDAPVVEASVEPDISIHSDFVHVGNADLTLDDPAPVPKPVTGSDEDDEEEAVPAPTPSFVKQADRRAFWRRPAVRGLLAVLFVVMTLAAALQVALQEHDRIAAQWPVTKPALEKMCEVMGCKVGPLRRIEAVVIDGSSFTRMRADAYRLSIVLKNNASIDVAMPSVELTLTDTQDEAVVRRVLSPADMGAGASLAAGAEWNGNVPVAVSSAGGAVRVAGYRVLAFYP